MPLPGGGGLGGSGKVAFSPACADARAGSKDKMAATPTAETSKALLTGRILLGTLSRRRTLVDGTAVFRRGRIHLGAVRQHNGARVGCESAVLGAVPLHRDFVAGFERILL